MNTLYYGDNLDILQRYVADESVDLIYLDPPFNSNANYNVLFAEKDGTSAASQIKAFDDTWTWTLEARGVFEELASRQDRVADAMIAFQRLLGTNDMLAYLTMMAPRLVELRRVLKPTGSLYLHCDPTASHYLKVLLDAVFGPKCFVNEITWRRTSAHSDTSQGTRHFGRTSDSILLYRRTEAATWNHIYGPYDEKLLREKYCYVEPETGRRFRTSDMSGPGGAAKGNPFYEVLGVSRYWRYSRERMQELIDQGRVYQSGPGKVPREKGYLDEAAGVPLQDIWTDIPPINSQAAERLGYPTQKPEALLERIILASSNEGDVVLDPFCGCGTTIAAAQKLGRQWLGIDVTHLAITLMKQRLADQFGECVRVGGKGGETAVSSPPGPLSLGGPAGEGENGKGESTAASPCDLGSLSPLSETERGGTAEDRGETTSYPQPLPVRPQTVSGRGAKGGAGQVRALQYQVIGEPTSLHDAEALALQDRHQFEVWALGLVHARPFEAKKGADRGIDGRIRFNQAATGYDWTEALISVKSGNVHSHDVRDLRGTIERDQAALGVFITLHEPTKAMRQEAVEAGFYVLPYDETRKFPRLQILTIKELLEGKAIECTPLHHSAGTFKQAPKAGKASGQGTLGVEE